MLENEDLVPSTDGLEVLQAIKLRYAQKEIYTYSGIVLIATNPFCSSGLPLRPADGTGVRRETARLAGTPLIRHCRGGFCVRFDTSFGFLGSFFNLCFCF